MKNIAEGNLFCLFTRRRSSTLICSGIKMEWNAIFLIDFIQTEFQQRFSPWFFSLPFWQTVGQSTECR